MTLNLTLVPIASPRRLNAARREACQSSRSRSMQGEKKSYLTARRVLPCSISSGEHFSLAATTCRAVETLVCVDLCVRLSRAPRNVDRKSEVCAREGNIDNFFHIFIWDGDEMGLGFGNRIS